MARTAELNDDRQEEFESPSPLYKFFLNPFSDMRFTSSCPNCSEKTRQRKLPLAIHIQNWGMVILNKTCRFCPACQLLIAHQDEIEECISPAFEGLADAISNRYSVLGTVERREWRRGMKSPLSHEEMFAAMHEFTDHLRFELAPRWEFSE